MCEATGVSAGLVPRYFQFQRAEGENMRIRTAVKILTVFLLAIWLLPAAAPAKKTKWNFSIQGQRRAFTEGLEAAKIMMEKADPDSEFSIVYGNALSPPSRIWTG